MNSHFLPLHIVFPRPDKERLVEVFLHNLLQKEHFSNAHLMHKEGAVGLCIHYDESQVSKAELTEIVCESGAAVVDNYTNKSFIIKHMHSTDCARLIELSLNKIDGIYNAAVTYSGARLVVEYDALKVSYADIKSIIINLGYDVSNINYSLSFIQRNRELIFSFLSGISMLWAWHMHATMHGNIWLLAIWVSYFFGSFYTFKHSLNALRYFRLDIDLLMLVAAFGAAFIGKWFEGALLLFLFSLGHGLEHKAMHKARAAVTQLSKLVPKTADVKNGATYDLTPVEKIKVNDIVRVKPGQTIACDGKVLEGMSAVNESSITGESLPVEKSPGDMVFAGTLNGDTLLLIKVTKVANDSTLSKMVRLILDADAKKSATQSFTEQFERYFVPFVFMVVGLMVIVPYFVMGSDFFTAFYKAMLVLVAASPCALAIGTPAAVLSAVARSAKLGVLIKGGKQLERFAMINTLALDKTGTITTGEPVVTKVAMVDNLSEEDILLYAASLEQGSSHPIASALIHAANDKGMSLLRVENITELPGRGILGFVNGHEVVIGNLKAFSHVSDQVATMFKDLQQGGASTMLLAVDGVFKGVLAVNDEVRPDMQKILKDLGKNGIKHTVMLTGDNYNAASKVAGEVGLKEFAAELMPEDKVRKITELERNHAGHVAMLGDGVNDAPAMAKALLGIAMGGAGSDVALEAADIVLMKNDISSLPQAYVLSKVASRVIKQNVVLALLSIVILVFFALTDQINLSATVFFHESTSILVVLNGLRLLRFKA